ERQSGGFAWIVRRNLSSAGSGQLNLLRFSLGPKWMSVADRYSITYTSQQESFVNGCPQGDFCPLQNGGWDTSAYNNIVGPEFGLNYQVERGRWTIETDLRFVAGMNWQNTLYRGSNFPAALGADYFRTTYTFANNSTTGGNTTGTQNVALGPPPLFVQIYGVGQTNATNTAEHNFVFSPLGEWRLRGRYRVSQAISMNVGYTGMWLAGITRASTNTAFRADTKPVLVATQNGPPITGPNPNPPPATVTQPSWTPPPVDPVGTGNNQVRVYNSVGPRAGNDLGYMFVNGVDFGIEVNY
ncbi:MAG: BBP7 family outer membrane beta-barrel protein, partial [Planctomycetia bacterium]